MKFTDPGYLREEQYATDANLRARIDLHSRFSMNPQPWHRWVFDRLDFGPEARILEVGCGPAELWAENRDRIPSGWRLTLADLSPGMVEAARAVMGDRAECQVANVQELPFDDESFDGAIANHMLYHAFDRARALGELARVLSPGGMLYAATNGADHLKEIKALLERPVEWGFGLEVAQDELAAFFEVELDLYPGDLEVTEAEPVLAFVRSLDCGEVEGARELVEETIAREGAFHVTKSTGLFSCRKP
ncbi:MAG TPA: class I SAM-dependent methyltransferase [Gaiellaceae bacterium]